MASDIKKETPHIQGISETIAYQSVALLLLWFIQALPIKHESNI
jgi:hypothetical protein